MPMIGGQWVNFSDLYSANQPQAQSMASGMATQVGQQAEAAQQGLSAAEQAALAAGAKEMDVSDGLRRSVGNATSALDATRDTYGIQALLQRRRAGTGYTPGMSLYDAALTGTAAGSSFGGLRGRYSDLFGGIGRAQGRVHDAYVARQNQYGGAGGGTPPDTVPRDPNQGNDVPGGGNSTPRSLYLDGLEQDERLDPTRRASSDWSRYF